MNLGERARTTRTGPIKLVIYRDGKSAGEQFFDHSAEAMHEAFDYVKSLLVGAAIALTHHSWPPQSKRDM